MRTRTTKLFRLLSVLGAASFFTLISCGSPSGETGAVASAVTSEAPTDERPDTPETEAEADDPRASSSTESQGDGLVTLVLDTWQSSSVWFDAVDAYEAEHPNVRILVRSSVAENYDHDVETRIERSHLGDLITCRGFDWSLKYFDSGVFASVTDLEGMDSFSPLDSAVWSTDDGIETFCVPVAGVSHALAYNADILTELGISPPTTQQEFQSALEAVAADGRYVPFATGLESSRTATTMIWELLGADNWKGESGRFGIISQTQAMTDDTFVSSFEELAAMAPIFPEDPRTVPRSDGIDRFATGQAAFTTVGSWELGWIGRTEFDSQVIPVPSDIAGECYAVIHSDFGLAMNADTPHPEETRAFLSWLTTSSFSEVFFNETSGYFSLQRSAPESPNPGLRALAEQLSECEDTERFTVQLLSRGDEDMVEQTGTILAAVLAGETSADEAAEQMQALVTESVADEPDEAQGDDVDDGDADESE